MTTLDPILYADAALRLTDHGAGSGGLVLVHIPSRGQLSLPCSAQQADAWLSESLAAGASADAAFNALAERLQLPVRIIGGTSYIVTPQPHYALRDPFRNYAEEARNNGEADLARRIEAEGRIVRAIVDKALADGMTISVHDEAGAVLAASADRDVILAELYATGENILYLRKDGKYCGSVYLIYGNSGWDVINDHSTQLEAWMAPIMALCNQLDIELWR